MKYETVTLDTAPKGVSLDTMVDVLNAMGVYNTHRPYSETVNGKTSWRVKTMTYDVVMLSSYRPLLEYLISVVNE